MGKKIFSILLIFTVLMAAACSCSPGGTDNTGKPSNGQEVGFTVPDAKDEVTAISFYYPDRQLENLRRIVKDVGISVYRENIRGILTLLLGMPESEEISALFGGKATLRSAALSRGIAIVDLGGNLDELSEREFFSGIVALTNTLTELPQINYVNFSINGSPMINSGILTNPMSKQSGELLVLWMEHQYYMETPAGVKQIDAPKALLYFPDLNSSLLLADVRTRYQNSGDMAADLFNELKNGPSTLLEMQGSIPKNVLLKSPPLLMIDDDGVGTLTLVLESSKPDAIDAKTRYLMAASIVLTMQGQVPDVDYVNILINGQPALEQSALDRSYFSADAGSIIGNIVTLYFPDQNYDYLMGIPRAMTQSSYMQPRQRIEELIRGLLPGDPASAAGVFPPGTSPDILLGVRVVNKCAILDFSKSFIDSLELTQKQETMFVYAIVNTLTRLSEINRVQFLIEGRPTEKLKNHIYVEGSLMANPGLVH